ncbi:hypothetical protein PR048_015495 [Dryococelus australis]|uniref:Uncharacterized protein n=1 Tax=Dryococelus australis TaxID=614101 RepID=A0ABQ9HHC6_9NEOP|nr:hypothetical protein PR048_015495 [Dryococelus australis]
MRFLKYKTIEKIQYHDPTENLDILWNISRILKQNVPGWQGVCQLLHKENSPLKKVVHRLGGLHKIMSILGFIGFVMTGAGLAEILEVIHAGNAVKYTQFGKAIAELFVRLLCCAQTTGLDLKEVFCCELFTYPASIFDKCGHMREYGKSQLAAGCTTKRAEADADVTIVTQGVASAQKYPTAIMGEDTDLLILLIRYVNIQCCDILLFPEPKKSSRYVPVYGIKQITQKLDEEVCSHILFAHAMLGCDTTSKPFGFRKSDTIKLFKNNDIFKENAAVFKGVGKTEEEIQAAGHAANATNATSQVKPEVLPPTKDASVLHPVRVYPQVQYWTGTDMDPLSWGRELHHGRLAPMKMRQAPAADHLMKFLKCGCTTTQCSTRQCVYKRQGVMCTSARTTCRGINCYSSMEVIRAYIPGVLVAAGGHELHRPPLALLHAGPRGVVDESQLVGVVAEVHHVHRVGEAVANHQSCTHPPRRTSSRGTAPKRKKIMSDPGISWINLATSKTPLEPQLKQLKAVHDKMNPRIFRVSTDEGGTRWKFKKKTQNVMVGAEKTHLRAASSGTIPMCESPRVTPPVIEPGSPSWEENTHVREEREELHHSRIQIFTHLTLVLRVAAFRLYGRRELTCSDGVVDEDERVVLVPGVRVPHEGGAVCRHGEGTQLGEQTEEGSCSRTSLQPEHHRRVGVVVLQREMQLQK